MRFLILICLPFQFAICHFFLVRSLRGGVD